MNNSIYNERTFQKKKNKAMLGMPGDTNVNGVTANLVVEAGALVADYCNKDDMISAMWLKPTSRTSCDAVIEYDGNIKPSVRNIRTIIANQFPDVELRLYSSTSKTGQKIIESARQLYRRREKKQKDVED